MSKLTPTEDLIMELLAARARLGEPVWTFDVRVKHQIAHLEELGLLTLMHDIVERTVRASLTDKGRDEYLSAPYNPPILEKYKLKKKYR